MSALATVVVYASRQTREFQERLGADAKPAYFLDQLLGDGSPSDARLLFRASALDSCLSSAAYARLSGVLDDMDTRASELRGVLRLFSWACETLTEEARRLFTPEYTLSLLDAIVQRGDRDALKKIRSLDRLADALLSCQLELAARQFTEDQRYKLGQGCFFIGMLADIVLRLPDRELLRLSRSNVQQPMLEELKANEARSELRRGRVAAARELWRSWAAPGNRGSGDCRERMLQ